MTDYSNPLLAPLGTAQRPSWRGRLHHFSLYIFAPLFVALFLVASGTRARVAVVLYACGVCSMLTASTIYHRWVHSLRWRAWWQRADHAMIYAAIAGSFTPICLFAAADRWSLPLLAFVWIGGFCGAAMKFTEWHHRRVVGGVLYIGLGWVIVLVLPALWQAHGALPVVLIMIGGAFYTGGAIGLYRKRPRLVPAVFGYHEVWHACTVVAAAAHFAAVWVLVARST